jgi:non-ribosomal peptide synthetase component F
LLALTAAVMRSVHRIIEMHAATNGDAPAVIDAATSCSYRELNAAANALARKLIAGGLRRGMRVQVSMPPSPDLAAFLLAILKAGGCYTWNDSDPAAASLRIEESPGEWRDVDISDNAVAGLVSGPNLPVVARETDIACVLDREEGDRAVAVPHATIISMANCVADAHTPWVGESGAFDLWAALMNGATAVVTQRPAVAA